MIHFKNQKAQLDFGDILLVPKVHPTRLSSRSEVDIVDPVLHTVPIVVANMDSIGTFEMAEHLKPFNLMVAILKDFALEDWEREIKIKKLDPKNLIPTLGTRDITSDVNRLRKLYELFPALPFICLDVANGYLPVVADAVKNIKDAMPDVKICAGNIVNEEGVYHLSRAGASIVKVGIGSGGVCLTRLKTGVGYPQFSAVQNAVAAAKEMNVQVISDGGITCVGDFAKAFAAGADMVMAGSFFAGHEETGPHFHGMSSDRSRTQRGEAVLDYRASEGRAVMLSSKGSLPHTLRDLLGGLRSACTYLGVTSLADLKSSDIEAIKVNRQLNRIGNVLTES